MKVKVFRSGAADLARQYFPQILLTLLIAVVCVIGLGRVEASGRAEGRRLLEESIQNAVVRHYAVYGSYPNCIECLDELYGINIERSKYAVFYEIIAPNIMPKITVVELA